MVDESFTSSKTSISNILLNDVRYIVPPYQRDYSWTAEQLENFWNDILEVKNSKSHFFGSMIFQKSDDNKELIVIDGQQRLATITILLAVIRDILYKEGDQKASILINQNYILKAFEDNKEFRKLSLNLSNDHYFYYCIQKELSDSQRQSFKDYEKTLSKTGKSNKLLKSSYEYFDAQIVNYIKDFDKIGKTLFLTDLSKTIREKFIFINIIVGSEEEAYLIFETINDRGLDLSVSDLFKNYLIRKSNEEKRKEIVESWNDITKKLDEKLRPFLLHYWLYKIEDTTERKLFSRLQLKIEKNQTTVQNFINDLRREAHIYSQFLNPELKFWKDEEILEILDDYNTLGITQSLPVLMSGKALYSLDPKKFKELLKLMISFTFRYTTICNFANNDLDKKFNLITKKMRNGEITEIEQIKGVLKEIDPTEKQFYDSFKNKDIKHKAVYLNCWKFRPEYPDTLSHQTQINTYDS